MNMHCVLIWLFASPSFTFELTSRGAFLSSPRRQSKTLIRPWFASKKIVDAEFERTSNEEASGEESQESIDVKIDPSKTLLDLSLEADPEWNDVRVPFVDERTERSIDATLAFVVELDDLDATYGIAIPSDAAAALVMELADGSVQNLSPDTENNDDVEELMQIMAVQLQEHVGQDLQLIRTPRVLTIAGPLEKYIADWQEKLVPAPVETNELMDENNENLEYFHEFMKKELGEEEYRKTMETEDEDISAELLELFSVPGLSDSVNDEEEFMELMKTVFDPPEKQLDVLNDLSNELDSDGAALKLISYVFGQGKSYSLVKLLKPFALVGKYIKEENADESDAYFRLLTRDEESLVVPKLEELYRADLEELGLKLKN